VRPIRRLGDGALVADVESVRDAHGLAAAVSKEPGWLGVEDVVVGYRSVVVIADPGMADFAAMEEELAGIEPVDFDRVSTREVEIPVCFDGPDLDEVAGLTGMSRTAVVQHMIESRLRVAFVGFLPGFAYLEGLAPVLAAVTRRSSPRTAVPAGSLAIGGGFAGIYPQASPGGWQLLGRTGFELFDPDTPPFATLRPGDSIRLRAVEDPGAATVRSRPTLLSRAARTAEVVTPGLLSMVQDLGRVGVAHLGVPRAGAADLFSLRAANRIVGNEDSAAAVEVTALGPRLRFSVPAHVAVVGRADLSIDGRTAAVDTVVPVASGQELSVGTTRDGLRCYLAVSGGIDIAPVLGSFSSDVLTGLGPGALRTGDVLGIGPAVRPRGRLERGDPGGTDGAARVLRVMPGPDERGTDAARRLAGSAWEVGKATDRMGVRLQGAEPFDTTRSGIASRGVVTGAVQVPADGMPVILGCDHATVGGYPVVATVVRADLGVLGQLRPGDTVRFEPVDRVEADAARSAIERALDRAVTGWFPVRTD
jgi:KipI family sensor histidine kinase inhibitor